MTMRFAKEARLVVEEATEIARDAGATSVEAEHLLLAVASHDTPVAAVLRRHGLDFDGLMSALADETARSLAAVGVTAGAVPFSPFAERPRLAASAKAALEQTLRIALAHGDKQLTSGHVTLAVLKPARGTVPRALACAGVDRAELAMDVTGAL
jgi:ATP-dependent Clp protease ATP-binding subunit ClpA